MPVKNGERYILESLESIYLQTLLPAVVLVVDDASSDRGIEKAIKQYPRIQVIRNLGSGQNSALNTGLRLVQTPFVSFLDVDDLWTADKQKVQLKHFSEMEQLEICCSGVTNFIEIGTDRKERNFLNSKQLGACTFRSEVFKYAEFEESSKFAIFDWWIQHGNSLNLVQTEQVHLLRRIHDTNLWRQNKSEGISEIMKTLRKKINE
jgi:glycosyltransferase involved in cell wall biosynthesis